MKRLFNNESRYVVYILDSHYKEKIWQTFEREYFQERKEKAVIPIFLDNTKFVGIPQDIVGIKFKPNSNKGWKDRAFNEILSKLLVKID